MSAKNIAILVDDLTLGSAGQQIVDRFLIGYTRDGVFEKRPFENVSVWSADSAGEIAEQRRREFPESFAKSREQAIGGADAIVFIQKEGLVETIDKARNGTALFVYGSMGEAPVRKAEQKNIPVCAGTVFSTLQQLPPMEIPSGTGIGAQIREALIVTQGAAPQAELEAFHALASILDRHGGVRSIRNIHKFQGDAVWDAGDRDWSWRMLASALSRTDKAQGNTLLDGRTEDIVGLGLTQKMAKNPRATVVEHSGGLRSTILVLDGVVADLLVAVRAGRRLLPGTIYSTQLFQSQTPQQEHFSRLSAVITDFFQTGKAPWDVKRAFVAADLAARLSK
jgi:hypothetical protein